MQTFSRTIYNKRLKYSKSCNSRGPTVSPTDHHRLHSEAVVSIDCMLPSTTRCHIPDVSSLHLDATSPPAKMSKMDTIRIGFPKPVTHSTSL
ncbi:hypothetical protein DPMN_193388 [Dreissena polymorpha]|uniref:Uncharacterized protein n=1 Tax=Dreissena polymorpha TaxID=45954 RepID=A0A9D3Y726_DREPO|nr:hypothetical protein DPMN_193388 [Dreissena polymorpha]